MLGGPNEVQPLARIDSGFWSAEVVSGSCLYFNEDQLVPVPGNQIDFAPTVTGAIVTRSHSIAEFAQMSIGYFFARSTPPLMLRFISRFCSQQQVPEPHFSTSSSERITLPRTKKQR